MRRNRNLREHRNKQLVRKRVVSLAERRRKAYQKLLKSRTKEKVLIDNTISKTEEEAFISQVPVEESFHSQQKRIARDRASKKRSPMNARLYRSMKSREKYSFPANTPSDFKFQDFSEYEYSSSRSVNACHIIESFGLGGAQTMMLELFNGLNTYCGEHINNSIVCIHRKPQKSNNLTKTYGVEIDWVDHQHFSKYLEEKNVDVVLHHRIAVSSCVKKCLPPNVKYVLLNHTWNSMVKIDTFERCDFYVSVCKFLDKRYSWRDFIHPSRKLVILNGVENNYLERIAPAKLEGNFKTGRCHRLIGNKFRTDSITWMEQKVLKPIPGFTHHLIGSNKHAKTLSKKYKKWFFYNGSIVDRKKKMSIIKALDVYFYETFADEGASMAVLESLAAGVPVISRPLGGTPELIKEGVNGFLPKDRSVALLRLQQLAGNEKMLKALKEKTVDDFNERLHIKYVANKYLQLFEYLLNSK